MVEAMGNTALVRRSFLIVSIFEGRPSFRNSCAASKTCAPQSPSAPVPYS